LLALLTSLVVVGVLLTPALIQRGLIDQSVPLRFVIKSRSEELTGAFFSTVLPVAAAVLLCLVSHRMIFSWTGVYGQSGRAAMRADSRVVFEGIYSSSDFAQNPSRFLDAAVRMLEIGWRFLVWLYLFSFAQAMLSPGYFFATDGYIIGPRSAADEGGWGISWKS
jgi:hypothetical protein